MEQINQESVDPAKDEPQVQLIISLMPDGQILINGPIKNKTLCYGLLECAKDAIRDFNKQESGIWMPFRKKEMRH